MPLPVSRKEAPEFDVRVSGGRFTGGVCRRYLFYDVLHRHGQRPISRRVQRSPAVHVFCPQVDPWPANPERCRAVSFSARSCSTVFHCVALVTLLQSTQPTPTLKKARRQAEPIA